MKILKSYYKTPLFLTGRCIVSLAILGLISCSDRNGKSLSEATNDPAGIYREYLYNIRRQKDSSFQVLTKHILQWQTVKDSVLGISGMIRSATPIPISVKSVSDCMILSALSSHA